MCEYVRVSFIWNVRQNIMKFRDNNYAPIYHLHIFISYIIFYQQELIKKL